MLKYFFCKNSFYFCMLLNEGELAQLARALRWQRRGHRFEPGILHPFSTYFIIYGLVFWEFKLQYPNNGST